MLPTPILITPFKHIEPLKQTITPKFKPITANTQFNSNTTNGILNYYFRGLEAHHTSWLINGQKLLDSTAPRGTWDPTFFEADSLEIIPGPQSAKYGAGIGGVFNWKIEKPKSTKIDIGFGASAKTECAVTLKTTNHHKLYVSSKGIPFEGENIDYSYAHQLGALSYWNPTESFELLNYVSKRDFEDKNNFLHHFHQARGSFFYKNVEFKNSLSYGYYANRIIKEKLNAQLHGLTNRFSVSIPTKLIDQITLGHELDFRTLFHISSYEEEPIDEKSIINHWFVGLSHQINEKRYVEAWARFVKDIFVYQMTLSECLHNNNIIFFHFGKSHRFATFYERHHPTFGSKDLKPEQNHGLILGLKKENQYELSLFFNWFKDLINFEDSKYKNLDQCQNFGIEGSVTRPISDFLRFTIMGCVQKNLTDKRLVRRPTVKLSILCSYLHKERHKIEMGLGWNSRQFDNDEKTFEPIVRPPKIELHLRYGFEINKNVGLFVEVLPRFFLGLNWVNC